MKASRFIGWTVTLGLLAGIAIGPASGQECPAFPCWDQPADPRDLKYQTLAEPALGLSIIYPSRIFSQVPTVNQDDPLLKFRSLDNRTLFSLSASANPHRMDSDTLMRWAEDSLNDANAQITYRRRQDEWFVFSGYLGDMIFYQKIILTHGGQTIGIFEIKFPLEQKPFYYNIVEQMSWSFVPKG